MTSAAISSWVSMSFAIVVVDQQLCADLLVLADQINSFGHGAEEAP
jgi:hypothetical protein